MMPRMSHEFVLLAAVARNGVIGCNNALPWHLPEDLRRFKSMTTGHCVLMGRKTFDSIVARLGHALPNRTSLVLTRDLSWRPPAGGGEVRVLHRIDDIAIAPGQPVFVIGGEEVYRQTLPLAHRLEITEIDLLPEGDAFFPQIDAAHWQYVPGEMLYSDTGGLRYRFSRYERRSQTPGGSQ